MTGIVVCANGLPHVTARCLQAVHDHTPGRFRLYLFDGVPWRDLTRMWQRGAELALADGCQYVVFLNNDTAVFPGWLAPLVDSARHLQHCAIGPVSNAPGTELAQLGCPGQAKAWEAVARINGFCWAVRTDRLAQMPLDVGNDAFLGAEHHWQDRATAQWGPPAIARHSYVYHWKGTTRAYVVGAP